jgi:hypothetical protein
MTRYKHFYLPKNIAKKEYSLADEIMEVPLITFKDVFGQRKDAI